jgi:hypothetical protein
MISALGDRVDFSVARAGLWLGWLNYLAGVSHE